MKVSTVAAIGALVAAAAAQAGTKPLYAPAPEWVLPAPAIDPAKDDSVPRVILDQQQRLADGQVWSYVDTANRVTSQQSLLEAGTIILGWQPDEGDLIVHRIAILRGGVTIDLLAEKEPLTVLRRERGLESLELDGVLTATMPVKGLEVGDILRVTYSVTRSDPALKGKMQSTATLLPDQTQVGFARIRALWPAGQDVKWKALAKTGEAKVRRVGAFDELSVATPMPKQPDLPTDAPAALPPAAAGRAIDVPRLARRVADDGPAIPAGCVHPRIAPRRRGRADPGGDGRSAGAHRARARIGAGQRPLSVQRPRPRQLRAAAAREDVGDPVGRLQGEDAAAAVAPQVTRHRRRAGAGQHAPRRLPARPPAVGGGVQPYPRRRHRRGTRLLARRDRPRHAPRRPRRHAEPALRPAAANRRRGAAADRHPCQCPPRFHRRGRPRPVGRARPAGADQLRRDGARRARRGAEGGRQAAERRQAQGNDRQARQRRQPADGRRQPEDRL